MKVEVYKNKIEFFRSTKQRDRTDLSRNYYDNDLYSEKRPLFQLDSVHSDEKTFLENFGNPIYHVLKEYIMVVVEKDGDKVSLKKYYGHKVRRAGVFWFKTSKNCEFITVNLKTGNFYEGGIYNYQKKRKFSRKIRCNYFLTQPIANFQIKLRHFSIHPNLSKDNDFYTRPVYEFMKLIDGRDDMSLSFDERLFKFYLNKKNLKYPNNFFLYNQFINLENFKKILKKNQGRLVDSVMQHFSIKGNKLKKELHNTNKLNISSYISAKNLFGEDWLNQDEDIIKNILNSSQEIHLPLHISKRFVELSSKKEKRNAFLLFKNLYQNYFLDTYTLLDHFKFWFELKFFGDTEIVWRSNGESESFFREEHLDWAEKLEYYKNGTYERIYPEIYYEKIKNFTCNSEEYFPEILSSSSDYNKESAVQSNCVKGYIGRASSLIISLRKGNIESEDRLTVEYKIYYVKNSNIIHIDRVQTRSKYNRTPNESWNQPLIFLDEFMYDLSRDPDFKTFKLTKICKNGLKMESETHFDEHGILKWSYEPIDKSPYQDYFI